MRPGFLLLALALAASGGDDTEIARSADGALRLPLLAASEADEFDGCSYAFHPSAGEQALSGWHASGETIAGIPLRLDDRTEWLTLIARKSEQRRIRPAATGGRQGYLLPGKHEHEARPRVPHLTHLLG